MRRTPPGSAASRAARRRGEQPTLVKFQGRPKGDDPKAAMIQMMGWLYPSKFG